LTTATAARWALERATKAAKASAESSRHNPLRFMRWTPPQDKIHRLRAKRKLLRSGNQFGKTTAALAEVIWRCTGTHPHYETKAPPIECWVVCTSWQQAVAIMLKFHELCPSEWIDTWASSHFTIRNGYGKDNPTVIFNCGSILRFRTTNQGPTALQGATVDYVLIDEPTDLDIYRELDRRLMRTGGSLCLSLTPVNRDCSWLWEMVEAGVVEEVHAKLTVDNLTPVGAVEPLRLQDNTLMDAEWIAEQWRITPPVFAPVVLDGAWETRPEGVFFKCFDRAQHVVPDAALDPSRGQIRWIMGIDYAAADRDYGQVAVLAQVQRQTGERGRTREAILVRDTVVMPGVATNTQFAVEVLRMLERCGLRWRDLHEVHGDNPVTARWVLKSNIETMRAISREAGVGYSSLQPRIKNAKEGKLSAGMVDAGCRYLYEQMAEGLLLMHPRCEPLAEAFETWDYRRDHPAKDRIDALRYGLKSYIFPRGTRSATLLRVG
jgi:phage terminase large subunit-like protein